MRRFTNNADIDLSVAVWLAHDDYDYVTKPNYISVTTLIKPIRQIILRGRVAALPVEQITLRAPALCHGADSSFGGRDLLERALSNLDEGLGLPATCHRHGADQP